MALIVWATGGAGFLFSVILLKVGLDRLWLRYTMSIAAAYGVFLLLIWLWLVYHRRGPRTDVQLVDLVDACDLTTLGDAGDLLSGGGQPELPGMVPGGGKFGGGGASNNWESTQLLRTARANSPAKSAAGDATSILDLDEFLVILAIIAAVGASIAVSLYLIASAPILFAEVLLDGALCAGLYRRLRRSERRHWLESAVRRTWIPVLAVMVSFALAGLAIQHYAPEAKSIGDVWRHYIESRED